MPSQISLLFRLPGASPPPSPCAADLDLPRVTEAVLSVESNFPSELLLAPCSNAEDVIFRLEIMRELSRFDSFSAFEGVMDGVRRMCAMLRDYRDERHAVQRQIRLACLTLEFSQTLQVIIAAFSSSPSCGFTRLCEWARTTLAEQEVSEALREYRLTVGAVDALLGNLKLAVRNADSAYFIGERSGGEEFVAERISTLTEELFGVYVKTAFSIVDPAPFSNLEERLLGVLMGEYPSLFAELSRLYEKYHALTERIDELCTLHYQMNFYAGIVKFTRKIASDGVPVCIPEVGGEVYEAKNAVCPALISKLYLGGEPLKTAVPNDILLKTSGSFVLSGPNQGGKTVYLRMVGLTAHLIMCGCPAFAESCKIPFFDAVHTHFMCPEVLGKSRLIEEVERAEGILQSATARSLVLFNESFTSTRRADGVILTAHYARGLMEKGAAVGIVSHYYELPKLLENQALSLVCGVGTDGKRPYKVTRADAAKSAGAHDIAVRCGMDYGAILEGLK